MGNDVLKAALLAGLVGAMGEDSGNENGNKCEDRKCRPVTFDDPAEARAHMIRMATLKSGDVIFGKYEDGSEFRAVFVQWENSRALCFCFSPEEGGKIGKSEIPVSVIWGVEE